MMKKALTLMAASFAAMNLMAQSFTDAEATFTWTVGNEKEAAYDAELLGAAVNKTTSLFGSDLTIGTRSDYAANSGVEMVTMQPGTSNAGCVATDMAEYTIKLKKGMTISVSSITYDNLKDGTDAAYYSWSYTVDGVESEPQAVLADNILRNNGANSSTATLGHAFDIQAEPCQVFTFRIYISNTANNKKQAFSNICVHGVINGEPVAREFQDFELDLRNRAENASADEVPAGVIIEGSTRNDMHGYDNFKATIPVDGPVQITLGGCQYSNTSAYVYNAAGDQLGEIDVKSCGCYHNGGSVNWVYNNEEADVLTIVGGQYTPYIAAKACELIPMCTVKYFDVDGKTLIGEVEVEGNSALAYAFGVNDVTVDEGKAFRGWFNSTQATALKVAEGTAIQQDLDLYAKASLIEVPTNTSRYVYELNKPYFYVEDHEAIDMNGYYHDAQHGWAFNNGEYIKLQVAGSAYVSLGNCRYSADSYASVTTADGVQIDEFQVKADDSADGAEYTFFYEGPATTLTITMGGTTYVHKVVVANVLSELVFDEETGYYQIEPNDVGSFLLAIAAANSTGNVKIFLPNGVYDMGETALTTISGNNISIIGESMEGTIIRNAPLVENEGIGTTATLLNTSDGLYLQDLTIQNALDYYKSGAAGRAVCLQDKGKNTIAKNVKMLSYQDTYYSNAASKFYWEDCEIHGTVDYLCGDGDVVYNRVKLVNESRAKDVESGDCTICAPYTSASCQWGYVFLDCQVETRSKSFNFGRSWGGESKAQYLRTTDLDGKLVANRFTAAGMNVAAYRFKEYQTMDAEGNITTPESHIMNFTHSTGNYEYETVMTDEEAAQYTLENIYGEWAPDQTAAQLEITQAIYNEQLSTFADTYLVETFDGETYGSVILTKENIEERLPWVLYFLGDEEITLRAANGRGGFGPAFVVDPNGTAIEHVEAAPAAQVEYNLFGQRSCNAKGICIVGGQKVMK